MTQQRFVNFGTPADAAKVKTINRQLFAPQVLRADPPFLLVVGVDELHVQPHGVLFANGTVLVEDEVKVFVVPTGFTPQDHTLLYRHIDEDIIGGSAATLELRAGLFETVDNAVILGWVRHPGGAVPLDASMVFAAPLGQVRGPHDVGAATAQYAVGSTVTAQSADISTSVLTAWLGNLIPGDPHEITVTPLPSRRLPWDQARVRVFCHDDGIEYQRVEVAPTTQQYMLDPVTGVATFNAADQNKTVDIADLTYGQGVVWSGNTAGSTRYTETAYSFGLGPVAIRRVLVDYVVLDDYTVDVVEVLDANNVPAVIAFDKVEPSSPDGTISRLSIRLLEGQFSSRSGQLMTVRLRRTLGPSGEGMELRTRVTTDDLPF